MKQFDLAALVSRGELSRMRRKRHPPGDRLPDLFHRPQQQVSRGVLVLKTLLVVVAPIKTSAQYLFDHLSVNQR